MFSKACGALVCALFFSCSFASADGGASAPGINKFGLKLLREELKASSATKNSMISPLSAYLALGMAVNGAGGDTRVRLSAELSAALENSLDGFNKHALACQTALGEIHPWRYGDTATRPMLQISNGAWDQGGPQKDFRFSDAYRRAVGQYYNASTGSLHFKDPASADVVNKWTELKTNGLIKKIMTPDEMQNLFFLLVNTVYFEGAWARPFYDLSTLNQPPNFTLADGREITTPMIRSTGKFGFVENAGERIVEIPFEHSRTGEIVMYVVVPKGERGPGEFFDDAFWTKAAADLKLPASRRKLNLELPKFTFDHELTMDHDAELTAAMDLGFLFADHANFKPMSTETSRPAKVGLIKQVTRIELDEKGVKAAAATAVGGIEATSIDMNQPLEVKVDRPFAFAIAEKTTGALLFVGQVQNPIAR